MNHAARRLAGVALSAAALPLASCAGGAGDPGPRSSAPTLAAAPSGPGRPVFEREVGEERPDSPIEAAAFRYQQRLSEDGTIPPDALMRAKAQRDALLGAVAGAGISPTQWEWIGPGNIGGRIRPIIIHPDDPDVMWVGSASGGIWKTTDGGQLWQPMDDFLPTLAVGCMAMDPTNPDVLYAGTGEGFFETVEGTSNTAAVRGAGIFRSVDGGETWIQLPSTAGPEFHFVNRLAIHPTTPSIMIAACNSGIWRTTDAGATWTRRSDFNALDVDFDPSDPTKMVAGGHHAEDGPRYSLDGGVTWQPAEGAGGHRQEMAYAPSDPAVVYASVSGDNDRMKVWRSTDGGRTFSLMTDGFGIQTWASYNNAIWVDPADPDTIVLGGVELFRSVDAGQSFDGVFPQVHADHHGIVAHPEYDGVNNRVVFFATDGGIYRTDDVYGNEAFDLNNNLGITQFYGAGINPVTGWVMGGTQDNGTLLYRGDPQDWWHTFGGDGGYGAADPTDPDIFYGEVQRALVHRTLNGGQNSHYIFSGPNPIGDAGGERVNFIPFLMLDPNEPNRMLVGGRELWRSNNVKANQPDWFSIKPSIEPPGPERPGEGGAHFAPNSPYNISTMAVAEGDPDRIWVGHNNGELWFTTNGTAAAPTWMRVDDNAPLPDRWVSTIVIDPNDHDRVYVAFMGWEPDNLWRSEDGGGTWESIAGSGESAIPEAPASALAVNPTHPGLLYVGTDIGVFTSDDDGATWTTSTEGPGTVPVEQLIWKDDEVLMAVTHGRGVFLADVGLEAAIAGVEAAWGTLLSGGAAELEASDDASVHVRSRPGFAAFEPNLVDLRVTLETDVTDPVYLDVEVESRIDHPSGTAKIRLRNFDTGAFDEIGVGSVGPTDTAQELVAIPAEAYVRASDGGVAVSVKHVVVATFTPQGFESFFDRVEVEVH